MIKAFKKLNKKTINQEKENGNVFPAFLSRQLFWFLARAEGFGNPKANIPYVAGQMYEDEPAEDQGRRPTNKENTDPRAYGDHRLNSILSGNLGFTHSEARIFHQIFETIFGSDWGNAISAKKLVTQPVSASITKGLASGLRWPENLGAGATMVTFENETSASFSIKLKDWPTKLGSQIGHDFDDLKTYDPRPVHTVGWEFLIAVNNIPTPANSNLFIFECPDRPMTMDKSNAMYDMFPVCLKRPDRNSQSVCGLNPYTKTDCHFDILEHRGGFAYYALTFPLDWDFQNRFGVPLEFGMWDVETSKIFLKNLRHLFLSHADSLHLASYAYRVE